MNFADVLCSRLLVRNPNKLAKLRSEISAVLGKDKNITRAHVQRMTYLHNAIKESKDLYSFFQLLQSHPHLMTILSTSTVPTRTNQFSLLQESHHPSPRRWPGRPFPNNGPRRDACCVFGVSYAAT